VITEAEFTRMLKEGVPFTRAPSLAFEYSNFGYALLGRIITNVSGMPYDQYIGRTIMRPLAMKLHRLRSARLADRAAGDRLSLGE
jgi:CubicO group peptidase (beta-lactamase class C family)